MSLEPVSLNKVCLCAAYQAVNKDGVINAVVVALEIFEA
jgi:hypothetical protein